MSTVEVEQPSLVAESSHHCLATDGVELTGFRPAPRRTSLTAIINVDDDTSAAARYTRPSRRDPPFLSMSTDERSPATVAESNPVVVIEDRGAGGTQAIHRGASNGAQNRPIVVLDSDEEQGQSSDPTNSSFGRRLGGARRRGGRPSSSSFRIFSPPPPPPQQHPVPPVPFLPPIVADPVPFAILPPPVNNNPLRNRFPFDQPAQSNNNNNAHGNNNNGNGIQLGGGLLSQGNGLLRRHGPRAQVRFQPRRPEGFDDLFEGSDGRPPLERATRIFGRFFASYFSGNTFLSRPSHNNPSNSSHGQTRPAAGGIPPNQPHHVHQDIDVFDWGAGGGGGDALPPNAGFFGPAAFGGLGPWGRRDMALGLGPDYDRRMTHPERAGPGWTYDFGAEQEEGRSKADGSEILVCAKCLDPLLANADGMVDVSEEEKKGRRVWSLRCGHVLDGNCVGILMRPEGERDFVRKGNPEDDGKGKEKHLDLERAGENVVEELVTSRDVKGKGKAPTAPIRFSTPPPLDDKEETSPSLLFPEPQDNLPTEDTSIRSRLRSRRSIIVSSSSAGTTSSSSPRRPARLPATPHSRGGASSTRRRGAKRKRATNVASEIVEGRYEWTCPVSGCERMHVSVKVGGIWRMDSEYGAVGIFV